MPEFILSGRGNQILSLPRSQWEYHLSQVPDHGKERLEFMSPNHHLVRNFVVRSLPTVGKPIPPANIAADLELTLREVIEILDELERNLFFLVRNRRGEVSWAFPVTAEPTPYQITFDSGEQIFAA